MQNINHKFYILIMPKMFPMVMVDIKNEEILNKCKGFLLSKRKKGDISNAYVIEEALNNLYKQLIGRVKNG